MADFIVIVILIAIVGSAIAYIVKEKKRGVKCIGCKSGDSCPRSGMCGGNCSSHADTDE